MNECIHFICMRVGGSGYHGVHWRCSLRWRDIMSALRVGIRDIFIALESYHGVNYGALRALEGNHGVL